MLLRQVLQKIIKAGLKELLATDDGTRVPRYEQALSKSAILTLLCQKKKCRKRVLPGEPGIGRVKAYYK